MTTTTNDEQYRAGFEAAIREINPDVLERWPGGQYKHHGTEGRWHGWCMAKREASTEPSADVLGPQAWSKQAEMVESWAAGALTDDAKDAARYRYIEDHATTHGGGHGFTITCFVSVDEEDMGCAIDAAIEAHTRAGSGK